MRANVVIRMGASKFEAVVRNGDHLTLFDLRKMEPRNQHVFRRALVQAFEESQNGKLRSA